MVRVSQIVAVRFLIGMDVADAECFGRGTRPISLELKTKIESINAITSLGDISKIGTPALSLEVNYFNYPYQL
mgnify:CR=1 FL=1